MANVIKHKRGSGSDPVASDLVVGEVAIRTDVGKLFTKMDNGSVAEIAGGGSDIIINTLSSSSATGGGSATFNGSAYRFTLSQPPSVSAQQLLVSVNGVIQKPVAGTGQPSEGFSVSGNDIIFGDAPATGADFFILTFKSLGVSEPADNSVTSAKIVDGAIANADINASAAIAGSKISPDFGSQDITTAGNITTTGGFLGIDGTLPQLRLNDTNSENDFEIQNAHGIFTIRDIDASADRLTINSAGRVAINGLTSPPGIFNINTGSGTSIANTLVLRRSGTNDYHGITLTTGFTQDWSFGQNSLNAFEVYENGAASTTRFTILNGGNTGIGTRSPGAKLHVVESTSIPAVKIKSGTSTNQNASLTFLNDNEGGLLHLGVFGSSATTFGANEATDAFISANNQLAINSQNASGAIRFGIGSTPNTKMLIDSDGDINFGYTAGPLARTSAEIRHFGLGRDYWNGTKGDYRALRLKVYDNGADDQYGFGISNGMLEIQAQADIGFFAGGSGSGTGTRVHKMTLENNGEFRILNGTKVQIDAASAPNNIALLNIGFDGGLNTETRAIDIDGNWSTGENKSISFTHGSNSADLVGQINSIHNSPGSSLRFGRLYHGANSNVYTMTLDSTSTTGADLTLHNGNLIFADGHGVDFSNTGGASGSTSHVLDDYEEGTWTPTASGFTISTTYSARYTKIGRLVYVNCYLQSATGTGTSIQPVVGGLPFTSKGGNVLAYGAGRLGTGNHNNSASDIVYQVENSSTNVKIIVGGGGINESMMSGGHVIFSLVYEVA